MSKKGKLRPSQSGQPGGLLERGPPLKAGETAVGISVARREDCTECCFSLKVWNSC